MNIDATVDPLGTVLASNDLPFIVIRLADDQARYRDAKDRSLVLAQRFLDMLSLNSVDNLELWGVRGNEEHLVWWTSQQNGSTLRWTTVENMPDDLFDEMAQRMTQLVVDALPSGIKIASPAAWGSWHPSFRYFRLAQLSDDLVEAFRNMFLAVESVLDHVVPAAGSGIGETNWIRRALDAALVGVDLEGLFSDPAHVGTPTDYILAVFYRFHRSSMFHSKLSYGSERLRLPHLEHERSVEQLESALSSLRVLYLKLASKHLGLDYRGGFHIAAAGFDAMMSGLVGRLTLHLTDDPTAGDDRRSDSEINPRNAWLMPLRTRNAKRLERRMTRYFLGVCPGDSIPPEVSLRGVVAAVDDDPVLFADTAAPLRPHGYDRFEVLTGFTALNQGVTRRAFRT